jgi:8-oxo-dGTP pyrophosphatase MutT (NUDIX family)
MTQQQIRPLALCVFSFGGRILVNEAHDQFKGQSYCRPLGGGIEFGEPSERAVVREIREELGAEITNLRFIGTLENIFIHVGRPGHEIIQVYDGDFVDRALYQRPFLSGSESDGTPFQAFWRARSHFSATLPLFPDGLKELLDAKSLFSKAA